MKYLLIDTTADKSIVAVSNDGKIIRRFGSGAKGTTSATIIPLIDGALADAGISVKELDCVFGVVGPGSFTGIRIGVCTAMAIAFGSGCQKCGLTVFDGFNSDRLCVIPSRKGYFYFGEKGVYGEKSVEEVENVDDFLYRNCEMQKGVAVGDDDYIANLFAVGDARYSSNDLTALEPMYLKKSQAERMKKDN